MKHALWMLLAAVPLVAQPPKLLINAQTDTRSAASGLDREFKTLLASQPQPAWIGYTVPATRNAGLGCDYVRDGSLSSGVVHLEPPDHLIVMFRVEGNQLNRLRSISPYCEIDAGGLPVHWLNEVPAAQSVALLASLVTDREGVSNSALHAIGSHADPSALDTLRKFIATASDSRIRERAVSAAANSSLPEATELLVSIATTNTDARLRGSAVSGLGRRSGPQILSTLTSIVDKDADPSVRRRALNALQSMPNGEGVPTLIQMARAQRDFDIRKQAMSSLQHSRDPRALAFFEEVIKK